MRPSSRRPPGWNRRAALSAIARASTSTTSPCSSFTGRTCAAIVDAGGTARTFQGDVADARIAEALLGEVAEQLGPVLCLVNNAGIRADNLAISLTDDEWSSVLETNLSAAFRLTRLALRP